MEICDRQRLRVLVGRCYSYSPRCGDSDNGWPDFLKARQLHRCDRNQGERILLCISTVLAWESGELLHKMCTDVEWFEVRLGRCLWGRRWILVTSLLCLYTPDLFSDPEI